MKSNANVDSWFGLDGASPVAAPTKSPLLSDDQLRTAIITKGTIAVVRVTDAQTRAEGMGNERVSIQASVERLAFGRTAIHLEMSRTGRYPGVVRGQRYMVAVTGTGELLGYVPVSGEVERALEGHRKVIERMILGR